MARIKPPCGINCPKRSMVCHDPEACEKWKIYLAKKAEEAAALRAYKDEQRMMDDYSRSFSDRYRKEQNPC